MPSHTFTRAGYWQDSINSNVAAALAAKREGQAAEELHASDYEIYAYLQTGQDVAARRVLTSLPEIAHVSIRVLSSAAQPVLRRDTSRWRRFRHGTRWSAGIGSRLSN
jgi:hypothetical protein